MNTINPKSTPKRARRRSLIALLALLPIQTALAADCGLQAFVANAKPNKSSTFNLNSDCTTNVVEVSNNRKIIVNGNGYTISPAGSNNLFFVHGGAKLNINNAILAGGQGDVGGGAIFNGSDGTVTISGGSLIRNSAQYGGAIENEGNLTLIDVDLTSNTATVFGGAIYNHLGLLSIKSNSHIEGNYADDGLTPTVNGFGGGIYNEGGDVSISGSFINNNTASFNGGAISNVEDFLSGTAGVVTLTDGAQITGNDAIHADAVDGVANLSNAVLYINNGVVRGNPDTPSEVDSYNTGTLMNRKFGSVEHHVNDGGTCTSIGTMDSIGGADPHCPPTWP